VVVNASLLSLLLLNNAVYALAAPDDPAVQQYRAVGVNLWCREDNPVACYDDNQPAPRAVEENTTRLRDLITRRRDRRSPNGSRASNAAIRTQAKYWVRSRHSRNSGGAGGIRILVVGFTIYRDGLAIPDTRPYVQFYAQESGNWILKGEVGLELRGCFWSHVKVEGRGNSKLRYWLSGRRYGDTGSNLRVQLFEYDGSEVRRLWHREGFTRGRLTVAGERFSIEYDRCPPGQNWGCSRALESWIVDEVGQVLRLSDASPRKK
jgi:hypothetical protein